MSSSRPQCALFKIVLEGDVRKINAESNNDPKTGGGARDIRFSHRLFEPVVVKMFPTVGAARRTKREDLEIRLGTLRYYDDAGQSHTQEIEYWPPTDARDAEGRIARVPDIPPLAARHFPDDEGAVFYLLIQGSDGTITAHFASEKSLRTPGVWNPWIAESILTSLAEAPGNVSARGWVDWTTGDSYIERRKPRKRGR
jgi:hypothetical protein